MSHVHGKSTSVFFAGLFRAQSTTIGNKIRDPCKVAWRSVHPGYWDAYSVSPIPKINQGFSMGKRLRAVNGLIKGSAYKGELVYQRQKEEVRERRLSFRHWPIIKCTLGILISLVQRLPAPDHVALGTQHNQYCFIKHSIYINQNRLKLMPSFIQWCEMPLSKSRLH